jgi:hypothetical protein
MAGLLLDAIQITVRIANGFSPDYGVIHDHGDDEAADGAGEK